MRSVRALTAMLGAAALVLLAVVVGGCGSSAHVVGSAPVVIEHYVDPAGWSLSYPSTMQLERSSSGPGLAMFSEVTIANFPQQRAVHTGRTRDGGYVSIHPPLDPNGRFPSDGVAFRMLLVDGGPAPDLTVADSRFPLRLATFSRPRHEEYPARDYSELGVPGDRDRPIEADGQQYYATALIGPRASPSDRAALARVIASLSFPRLKPGTTVGAGLTVLQRASRYPVGSFTLVHAPGAICTAAVHCHGGSAPFYLVHAPGRLHVPDLIGPCSPAGSCTPPGAFYALGWTDESVLGGYTSRCHLRLDRRDDQFVCTNIAARWDRVGRVIRRPPGARVNDNLQFAFAKVAWDGHVVLAAGIDENPPRRPALRMLWPTWKVARPAAATLSPACRSTQVRLQRPAQVYGLLGTEVVPVVIRNVSNQTCTLAGYPRVQVLGARHEPLTVRTVHGELGPKEPARVSTIVLAAGTGRASFGLSFTDHPSPAPVSDCRRIHFIRATLPGQPATLTTAPAFPVDVCGGRPKPWLYVSPVGRD